MASYTEKYKLKKPAPEDFADIADINENMDLLEGALLKKADLDEAGKIPLEQLPESGSDLELGETSDTAYRGDHGKTAYEHSQANGNPHGAAARDIGYTDTEKLGATNVQDAIDVTARMAKTAHRYALYHQLSSDAKRQLNLYRRVAVSGLEQLRPERPGHRRHDYCCKRRRLYRNLYAQSKLQVERRHDHG